MSKSMGIKIRGAEGNFSADIQMEGDSVDDHYTVEHEPDPENPNAYWTTVTIRGKHRFWWDDAVPASEPAPPTSVVP